MEKVCNACGQPAVYKEGNKNGKPWAAYFCSDKANCGNVEWVSLKANEHKPAIVKASSLPTKQPINIDSMRLSYRKDLMVALVNSGCIDPETKFQELWGIVENG